MRVHSAMVKSQKAMDMEFNGERRSKKPKTVAIDEHVAAKQSLLKDAKAADTKVTKVIDEALTATVTWPKLMGEGKLEHANPRVLNKVQAELVKVEKAKSRIMTLEVNIQVVEPQRLHVEWRKKCIDEITAVQDAFLSGAYADMKRCLRDVL